MLLKILNFPKFSKMLVQNFGLLNEFQNFHRMLIKILKTLEFQNFQIILLKMLKSKISKFSVQISEPNRRGNPFGRPKARPRSQHGALLDHLCGNKSGQDGYTGYKKHP